MPPQPIKRRPTYAVRDCPHCGRTFNARGYGRHELACRRDHAPELPIPFVDFDGIDPEDGPNFEQSEGGMSLGCPLSLTFGLHTTR